MFSSHATGAWVIGHVTYGWAVVFVASAIADFPAHPPKILSFYTTPVKCTSLELFSLFPLLSIMLSILALILQSRSGGGQLDMATSGV